MKDRLLPVLLLFVGFLFGVAASALPATAHEPSECAPCPVCAPGLTPEVEQAAKEARAAIQAAIGPMGPPL